MSNSGQAQGTETAASGEAARVGLSEIGPGQQLRVENLTRRRVLASTLRLALGPLTRLRGLLGAPPLAFGEGLLLRPCAGVHTCFMRYAIDVAFLDASGRIVALEVAMSPWRFSAIHAAALATLELPANTLAETGSTAGDLVAFVSAR